MAKEDDLKKVELKVYTNCCDGCQRKVLKALSIKGVLKTEIHPTLPKLTVIGNIDALTLIKKLAKAGKPAELWKPEAPNQAREDHHKSENPDQKVEKAQGSGKEKGNGSIEKGEGDKGNNKKAVDEKQSSDGTAGGKPIPEVTTSNLNNTTSPITIPQVSYVINPSMVQNTAGNATATASYAQVSYAAQPCVVPMACSYSVPPPCCAHHQYHYELPVYHAPPPIQPLAPRFSDYFSDENTVGCSVM